MPLDYLIFDPSPCGFPKPQVAMLPGAPSGLTLSKIQPWAAKEHFRHFARGRYALHEAFRVVGIGPGTLLLAPSYHCRTMLDPALALGGEVVLYPVTKDLSPNLASIQDRVAQASLPVKAILVTHYFGFPQDLQALALWCEERNIALIEDCSHALFCEQGHAPGIGQAGNLVVSSPYKFLPCPDGGLLYARRAEYLADIAVKQPSLRQEIRGIATLLAGGRRHRPAAGRCNPRLTTDSSLDSIPRGRELRRQEGCSPAYHASEEGLASLRISRLIMRHANLEAAQTARRQNYQRWATSLVNVPHCRPIFPELPDDCTPYMFPLHIESPDRHFYLLKQLGLPIWRWDSLALSDCLVAREYRTKLLHLPCHQCLSQSDLDWMIETVSMVMEGRTPGGKKCPGN